MRWCNSERLRSFFWRAQCSLVWFPRVFWAIGCPGGFFRGFSAASPRKGPVQVSLRPSFWFYCTRSSFIGMARLRSAWLFLSSGYVFGSNRLKFCWCLRSRSGVYIEAPGFSWGGWPQKLLLGGSCLCSPGLKWQGARCILWSSLSNPWSLDSSMTAAMSRLRKAPCSLESATAPKFYCSLCWGRQGSDFLWLLAWNCTTTEESALTNWGQVLAGAQTALKTKSVAQMSFQCDLHSQGSASWAAVLS